MDDSVSNVKSPGVSVGQQRSDTPFRALVRTFGLVRRTMAPYFMRFGISGSQWGILRAIDCSPEARGEGIRLTDLGARLLVRPPSITRAVDRMERMGLVQRRSDTGDQRVKLVRLTPAGQRIIEQVTEGLDRHVDGMMGGLTPQERQELHRLLDRLAEHLESLPAGAIEACGED